MKRLLLVLALVVTTACAGFQRDCASWNNRQFGSDWIVVQFDSAGRPFNCWKLENTVVTNAGEGDGVWWQSLAGHIVHAAGWYNRAQVKGKSWDSAGQQLGVPAAQCSSGSYQSKQ